MRKISAAVLLLVAGGLFVLAARSGVALRTRSDAIARSYAWRDIRLPEPARPVADVQPAQLEEAPAPVVKVKRVRKPAPVVEAAPRIEVEPEDAIRLALRGKRASFERCYELELKKQAAFSGFVVVAVSVSAEGKVLEAKVQEGNRRDAVVGACIAGALRTMQLPQLTSDADLLIPIRLEAKEPT